jgi:hypothetical protein
MGLFSSVFGSGGEQKTKTSSNYSGQSGPLLKSQSRLQDQIFNLAQNLYNQTPKDVYGGDLVAPMSGATGRSLGMLSNLAGQDFGGQQIG